MTILLDLLAPLANDPAVAAEATTSALTEAERAAMLLGSITDVDRIGASGLSALHVAALFGPPALLEKALARSADPSHPTQAATPFACTGCVPAEGGFEPQLLMPPGSTALDMVEQASGIYVTLDHAYGKKGGFAPARAHRVDELARGLALLRARGARHGEPRRESLPPWVAEMDDLLAALGRGAGLAEGRSRRAASAVATQGIGPWAYFTRTIDILGDELSTSALVEPARSTLLGILLLGEHRAAKKPKPKGLPAGAQKLLKSGYLYGQRGERYLVLSTPQPGRAQFAAVSAAGVEVLADDVATFLRRELAALGIDASAAAVTAAGQMRGPTDGPSLRPRILRASYDAPPAPAAIDRVGGLPIGVTAERWPRRAGKPMHHVLTLDLKQHPTLEVKGKRAVAFFISSPQRHEAYAPGNDHVAVLLLDEADLASGQPAWPSDLEGDRLRAGSLLFEDGAGLSKRQLLARSHAAWTPTWLQADHDAEIWAAEPGQFVLQLTTELVPGLSLGDLGVMYVFSQTAFFQCH